MHRWRQIERPPVGAEANKSQGGVPERPRKAKVARAGKPRKAKAEAPKSQQKPRKANGFGLSPRRGAAAQSSSYCRGFFFGLAFGFVLSAAGLALGAGFAFGAGFARGAGA